MAQRQSALPSKEEIRRALNIQEQADSDGDELCRTLDELHVDFIEIMKISATDPESLRLLSLLLEMKIENKLDKHYQQFLHATGRKISVHAGINGDIQQLYEGHISIGWHKTCIFGPDTFILGRSSRFSAPVLGLDILLAPENDLSGRRIDSIHIALRMHPLTGAWFLDPLADMHVDQ